MKIRHKWTNELQDDVWRVMPLDAGLVVGTSGKWRDAYAMGFGRRGMVTAGTSDDVGITLLLDCEGKKTTELPNTAPIRVVGDKLLVLRNRCECILCSSDGTAMRSSEHLSGPLNAIVSAESNVIGLASLDSPTGCGPKAIESCEFTVLDGHLETTARFLAENLVAQAACDEFVFGCDFHSSQVVRTDLNGNRKIIADLGDLNIEVVHNSGWIISYDESEDRVLASSTGVPHAVACLKTDGRVVWCRVINPGCCAGPMRRIGTSLVVASGCRGCVTWLSSDGQVQRKLQGDSGEGTSPISPVDVEPGPNGCVFAFRGRRLCCFCPSEGEITIGDCVGKGEYGAAWWPAFHGIVIWDGRTIRAMKVESD